MTASYTEEAFGGKYKWPMVIAAIVAVVILLWFWWPQPAEPVFIPPIMQTLPKEIQQSGKFFPLPYEGKLLPGRPKEPMPIPRSVYADVELTINGKQVEKTPILFPAGSIIEVEGTIWGQPDLPWNVSIGGSVGIVQNAKNKRGWILHSERGSHSNTTSVPQGNYPSVKRCTFEVKKYKLPEEPGEYLLVVLSWAHIGGDHPELIAAKYDLLIE
ncbi:MAG: hypothetical protein JKY95_16200 [Planctomycetaceae bacterium]|nr:hypothetical protein [Planctomycetaceae bacterium]